MSAETAEVTDAEAHRLAETIAQAWALYNRLLGVGSAIGCGMFMGCVAASSAVAGGFELGLASAAKTVCLFSHAERIHDLVTAVEEAVVAAGDPPTHKDLAVIYIHAARLAGACAAACGEIEGEKP